MRPFLVILAALLVVLAVAAAFVAGYTLRGTTVVVRREGKIVRESHFYDVASLHKQVYGTSV